jgi:DNA replication factor GINS
MLDIQNLVRVHAIGNDLHDVKVEFNRDLKIDISDITVEGRQGEIINIPRWIADILHSAKHVEIKDEDMFSELKQSIVKEKVQGEFDLSTLDDYFYIKLKSYMKRLSENDYDKVESMLNTLLRKRQGKIVHLADSSKLTHDISQKLSIEEREFFNQIYKISTKFSKKIVGDKK